MHSLVRRGGRDLGRHSMFLLLCVLLSGCRQERPANNEPSTAAAGDVASYPLKGIVVSSDAKRGEVSIDSQAIPGLMGAMTMSYKLAQPGIATELHTGDHLTAVLHIANSVSTLDQIVVTDLAKPDYKPATSYNVPQAGEAVPNFTFLNQNGKTISIAQFRGKVLLVTFIYTRCPLPDYCIRMSRNFATIQRLLAANPQLYKQTHLLSVSFDPAYDTPKVLRSYGNQYTGEPSGEMFSHWDFAVPASAELDMVDQFFDVGVSPGANNTLTHSLSTAVISPDGKIFRWYPSNDWLPSTAVDDIQQAVAKK
jgi:protein SCO1